MDVRLQSVQKQNPTGNRSIAACIFISIEKKETYETLSYIIICSNTEKKELKLTIPETSSARIMKTILITCTMQLNSNIML